MARKAAIAVSVGRTAAVLVARKAVGQAVVEVASSEAGWVGLVEWLRPKVW